MSSRLATRPREHRSRGPGWGSVWAVRLFRVAIALLVPLVISREERYLESPFGEEYLRYRATVGRWFWR